MYPLAQSGFGFFVFLCLIALVVWVSTVMKKGRQNIAQQNARRPTRRPSWELPTEPSHAKESLDSSKLDSKIGVLEQLIREADRAAARLEAALASSQSASSSLSRGNIPDDPAIGSTEGPSPVPPASQADALRPAGAIDVTPQTAAQANMVTAARTASDDRYDEIYALADYGLELAEISQRVGSPVGEIELILGLRGKR